MPKLVVIKGSLKGQTFELGAKDIVFCGRYPRMNDIAILEIAVSRKHFKIFRVGEDLFLEDLKSKHGTKINDRHIEPGEGFQIVEGDLITAGNTVMRLTEVSAGGSLIKDESAGQNKKDDSSSDKGANKERRSAKELELFYTISELLKKSISIRRFFEEFLEILLNTLPRADNANVILFELNQSNKIRIVDIITTINERSKTKYSKEILKRVIRERKTVRMSNTDFEPSREEFNNSYTLKLKSILCIPILSDNEIYGVVYIDSKKPYSFRKRDQLFFNSLVGPMAVAIEKNRLASSAGSEQPAPPKSKIINFVKGLVGRKKKK